MIPESQLIKHLRKRFKVKSRGVMGIGDDAASFRVKKNETWVSSADVIVEGVDFTLKSASMSQIGYKALAVNLSDMAAMGAVPRHFFVTLGIPSRFTQKKINDLYRGMRPLMKTYKLFCLGGDISRSKELFISIHIMGIQNGRKLLLRSQARTGDRIGVTGSLGGSINGKHLNFKPRIKEGLFLSSFTGVKCGMDISDGLSRDLTTLLDESKSGADIEIKHIPVSVQAQKNAGKKRRASIERALSDGEDFELLFTVPEGSALRLEQQWKKRFKTPLSWIGRVKPRGSGLRWYDGVKLVKWPNRLKGYDHFK